MFREIAFFRMKKNPDPKEGSLLKYWSLYIEIKASELWVCSFIIPFHFMMHINMYIIAILDLSPEFPPTSQLYPEDETNAAAGWASAPSLSGWERLSKDVLYTVRPGRRQMWSIAYQWQPPPVLWQMPQWGQRRPRDWELPQQGLRGGCTQWQYSCPQPRGKYQWHKICLEMCIEVFIAHWTSHWFL